MPQHYALDGARADLTAPDEILALMAQDLNDLRRENYSVTMHELQSLGWSKRQLLNHFQPALDEAARNWSDNREPTSVSARADSAQLAQQAPGDLDPIGDFIRASFPADDPGTFCCAKRLFDGFLLYLRQCGLLETLAADTGYRQTPVSGGDGELRNDAGECGVGFGHDGCFCGALLSQKAPAPATVANTPQKAPFVEFDAAMKRALARQIKARNAPRPSDDANEVA